MSCTNQKTESITETMNMDWYGKVEPISPPSSELISSYESSGNWPFNDNFADEIKYLINNTYELKPDDLDISQELIDGDDIVIELYDIKELKDENWSDAKSHAVAPELLDYHIGIVTQPNVFVTKEYTDNYDGAVLATQTLGAANFENAIFTQLTPPQSPPQSTVATSPALDAANNIKNVDELLPTQQQQQPQSLEHHNHQQPHIEAVAATAAVAAAALPHESFTTWDNGSHTPANEDIARDVQIVDDIVNTRAKELFNWQDDCESQSSSSVLSQSESTIDEEWYPECSSYSTSISSASSSPTHCTRAESGDVKQTTTRTATQPKKRTRAYGGRGVEDRKIRKKEQNKNAATRYRQKKKSEMENVLSEEQTLASRNEELVKILADCVREQKYLKSLIREFYAHKKRK